MRFGCCFHQKLAKFIIENIKMTMAGTKVLSTHFMSIIWNTTENELNQKEAQRYIRPDCV